VTGPSLTNSTRISVRNRPVGHGGAVGTETFDHSFDERFGLFGAGGGDPARTTTLRGVAVERELADDQHLTADVGDRAVHHPGVVVEDPQTQELVGQLVGERLGVVVGDPDEHAQSRADRAGDLPLGVVGGPELDRGTGDTLHERSHRCSIAR
jgi:hypothetical protein